jgi:hypothetical protein
MRNNKARENETMANFNDFVGKVKTSTNTKSWMSGSLSFKIDSEHAYDVDKANAYEKTIGTGANFE